MDHLFSLLQEAEQAENLYTYPAYLELMETVVAEKRTTGPNQGDDYAEYTRLNWARMQRLNKTTTLTLELKDAIQAIQVPQKWYVLTEAWCGDAAQNVPVLAKIADASPHIELRLLLRDENPAIMDLFLTNNGRSIPKLFALNEQREVLFTWGPRPRGAQALYQAHQQNPTMSFQEFVVHIQNWYNQDKTQEIQQEIAALLRK